jgi:hypothetical protein
MTLTLTVKRIDQVVCAEIPDLTAGPYAKRLHDIVTSMLIHPPYGANNPSASCMKMRNGVLTCSKGFPGAYRDETMIEADGSWAKVQLRAFALRWVRANAAQRRKPVY